VERSKPRKNLARIAQAVDGELRVVGARGWGSGRPNPPRPTGSTWLVDVDERDRWRGSRCAPPVLVYASLSRGFRDPVLPMRCRAGARSGRVVALGDEDDRRDDANLRLIRRARVRSRGGDRRVPQATTPNKAGCDLAGGRGATRAVYEELRVILIDADVLGRQPPGKETSVLERPPAPTAVRRPPDLSYRRSDAPTPS